MYSARQLVSLGCQIAKVQSGMAPQAGQFLNMILAEYAQTMDLDTVRKTATLNVTGAPTGIGQGGVGYLLPADYLREVQLSYSVQGIVTTLDPLTLEDYNALFQGSSIGNYPENYATDISAQTVAANGAPLIYFWPAPGVAQAINLLYRPQTSDIASPENSNVIPWFPNQRILLRDLCVDLMLLADDSRKDDLEIEVERRMRKYLIMKDDKEGVPVTVKLDPRHFRASSNLAPTKAIPF